jgi:hypothetical protein
LIDFTQPKSSQSRVQCPNDAYQQSFGGPMDHAMHEALGDDDLAKQTTK